MTFRVNPALEALFGSATRAKVLGFLANTREPRTGYAISKALDAFPSKVYPELRDLASAGFLRVVATRPGRKAYILVDDDLRRFLAKRFRMIAVEEWFAPAATEERERAAEAMARIKVDLPVLRPRPSAVPNREEFERSAEKDRALARIRRMTRGRLRRSVGR